MHSLALRVATAAAMQESQLRAGPSRCCDASSVVSDRPRYWRSVTAHSQCARLAVPLATVLHAASRRDVDCAQEAAAAGCAMVCLPECFAFIGSSSAASVDASEPLDGDTLAEYCTLARFVPMRGACAGPAWRRPWLGTIMAMHGLASALHAVHGGNESCPEASRGRNGRKRPNRSCCRRYHRRQLQRALFYPRVCTPVPGRLHPVTRPAAGRARRQLQVLLPVASSAWTLPRVEVCSVHTSMCARLNASAVCRVRPGCRQHSMWLSLGGFHETAAEAGKM